MSEISPTARFCAIVIAGVTALTLLLRIYLAVFDYGSVFASISHLSQFFTILTNFLILVVMTLIGLGRRVSDRVLAVSIVAITGVGVVYHTLLAHLWDPEGLAMIADQGVHTVVPLLSLVWWCVYFDMCAARWTDALWSVVWPLIYVSYALLRAEFSGFYPYPFLDLETLGWGQLGISVLILTVVFFVLGLIMVGAARVRCLMRRRAEN